MSSLVLHYFLSDHYMNQMLQLSHAEASAIAAAARNPESVLDGKIPINGVKYPVISADDSSVHCCKVES